MQRVSPRCVADVLLIRVCTVHAQMIKSILKDMGITRNEPAVVAQLLQFCHRVLSVKFTGIICEYVDYRVHLHALPVPHAQNPLFIYAYVCVQHAIRLFEPSPKRCQERGRAHTP